MSRKIQRVDDVASWRMCMGCGACKWFCPNKAINLVHITNVGIRPVTDISLCRNCGKCLEVCPGISLSHISFPESIIPELKNSWGPILSLYEGYASDQNIRYSCSSGGIATVLALYGLEKENIAGILHIRPNPSNPLENVPFFSTSRKDLLAACGSRYAPAAPCQAFEWIKQASLPCIFIGKPCDIAALRKAQKIDPILKEKVLLAISIFCAGTPATAGTLAILDAMGVKDPSDVESFRYRGNGWPGMMEAKLKTSDRCYQIPYEQGWGMILTRYGQLRCRLCADSTGEFADISCGDLWYKSCQDNNPGLSLVVVRTEKGKEYFERFLREDYAKMDVTSVNVLPNSQQALNKRRCMLWGRLLIFRVLGLPSPIYQGIDLSSNWKRLSVLSRLKVLLSTLKRIIWRKWYKPEIIKSDTRSTKHEITGK